MVPVTQLGGLNPVVKNPCIKLVDNCEQSFFQRPDDAVNRGTDLQTELDLSGTDNFISNFQPLTPKDARELIEDVIHFEEFSRPMRNVISQAAQGMEGEYFVSSAHPRLVDGKPSLNVRYLQLGPDIVNPVMRYLSEISTRLARGLNADQEVHFPVNAGSARRGIIRVMSRQVSGLWPFIIRSIIRNYRNCLWILFAA